MTQDCDQHRVSAGEFNVVHCFSSLISWNNHVYVRNFVSQTMMFYVCLRSEFCRSFCSLHILSSFTCCCVCAAMCQVPVRSLCDRCLSVSVRQVPARVCSASVATARRSAPCVRTALVYCRAPPSSGCPAPRPCTVTCTPGGEPTPDSRHSQYSIRTRRLSGRDALE